ncbi:MAG: class I SAM-dependent methyltransferase [Clostridiales Family XIII bacterium]|jgi:ubiquinone/menaquinone biosynthesis C-methylase UbiE|nr:class I SAM-dependent methyltransferase [Clostridiales Family XIII bacterium]
MGNIDKFDGIAAQYDTPGRVAAAAAIAGRIRVCVGAATGKTAIDYGCGTGLVGLQLLDIFKSVLFVDASENMLAAVTGKNPYAQTLCADIMSGARLPSADYILLVQTLLHEKDTRTLLARLCGVLNEGGRLLVVDFDKNQRVSSPDIHNGFDRRELVGILEGLGCRVNGADTFYHGENMLMGQDASLFLMDAEKLPSQ